MPSGTTGAGTWAKGRPRTSSNDTSRYPRAVSNSQIVGSAEAGDLGLHWGVAGGEFALDVRKIGFAGNAAEPEPGDLVHGGIRSGVRRDTARQRDHEPVITPGSAGGNSVGLGAFDARGRVDITEHAGDCVR
ncbi:Uncharacterised protein [Mycobacteroides abscessus subsp. abscessus]|nr:Uncharacterised protein [Mycobacteroides abscessus subsp. abscessus]